MAHKELRAIVEAYAHADARGLSAALVTVVKTSGSTYRRPGARMLVLPPAEDGGRAGSVGADFLGSISGGCLEDDARAHALETIATGRAAIVRYDTTAEGDILFGTGLGCQGVVHILIQPLNVSTGTVNPVDCIRHALETRRPGALATVIAAEPSAAGVGPAVGDTLWLASVDESAGSIHRLESDELADAITADARAVLRDEADPGLREYPATARASRVEVFLDMVRPPRSLLICGAGYDAVPVARLSKELGWRIRVVDGRRAYLAPERFPGVDELIHCPPTAFGERIPIEPGESAVVMTHNYLHDRAVLGALLASEADYIGVLGPRRRTDQLLAEIAAGSGADSPFLGKASLRRLHGPAGLDIGAESPEQIALAIVAEIEAVSARRGGGLLKHRLAPLHAAAPA